MTIGFIRKILCVGVGVCACLFSSMTIWATEVSVVGMFGNQAVLVVDGKAPHTFSVGRKVGDVRLVAIEGEVAVVEVDGKRRRLRLGEQVFSSAAVEDTNLTLTADSQGHFFTIGTINGATVRFIVDTGATMVSIGATDARRANISLKNAKPLMSMTANGMAQVWKVKLASIRVGNITLSNVDALVHTTDMPVVLLGMSFLNRMEMKHEGSSMTLRKRY